MNSHNAESTYVKRRQFLKSTAAAAATTTVFGSAQLADAAENTPKPYKKAVKIGMVQVPGSLTEKFKMLKQLGFDGVELNSPSGTKPEEVAEAKKASGLDVHGVVDSVHWRSTLSHPDPSVRQKGLDGLQTAIRAAKDYGATSVLLVPAVVKNGVTYEQAWERSIPEIRKAIPLAEELGIRILLENVWNNFLKDPKETARYIDELKSDVIGAYFDVGNAVRYSPPAEWVRVLGEKIVKLDIKEYSLSKGKKEGWSKGFQVKLLEGECNWPDVMKELKKIGYAGWGTAEIRGGGKERLTEIAERMNKIFAS